MPCFSVPFTALCWSCPAYSRLIPTYSQWVRGYPGTQGTFTKLIRVFLHDFRVSRASSRLIPISAPMLRGPYGTPLGSTAFLPASYHDIPFQLHDSMDLGWVRRLNGRLAHQLSAVPYGMIGMAVRSCREYCPTNSITLPYHRGWSSQRLMMVDGQPDHPSSNVPLLRSTMDIRM